jgi:hypothetical protein
MCHRGRHHRGRHGFGRFGNREEWLEHLEQYRRNLEQELADVSDMIKRLREETPTKPEPQSV